MCREYNELLIIINIINITINIIIRLLLNS